MEVYRRFIQKYAVVGNLMLVSGGTYLLLLLLIVILGPTRIGLVFEALTLPMDLGKAVQQPWSIFTFWAVNHPFTLWMALVDIALMFSFGMLLQTMVGRERFKWLVVSYISAIALLTLFFAQILPTVSQTEGTQLFGMHALNAAIIMTCIVLAPRLRVRLYLWEVELYWIGVLTLLLPLVAYRAFFTVIGLSILVAILTGAVVALYLRYQNNRFSPKFSQHRMQQQSYALDRVRVREVRPNPQHKGKFTVVGGPGNTASEDDLDKLLDRINEVGYQGLSAAEKKRLEELSK
jgi:hypothetical protein